MANIDDYKNPKFVFNKYINVGESVGKDGENKWADVIVAQALLKYAAEGRAGFSQIVFPEPNGQINGSTVLAIREYQQQKRKFFGKFAVDGRIDPARGSGFKWTIRQLNNDAFERWLVGGQTNGNYIHDIVRNFPRITAALPNIPVGTLGLTLEPSCSPVGSLNLCLE
jgi:hypothetical protein